MTDLERIPDDGDRALHAAQAPSFEQEMTTYAEWLRKSAETHRVSGATHVPISLPFADRVAAMLDYAVTQLESRGA